MSDDGAGAAPAEPKAGSPAPAANAANGHAAKNERSPPTPAASRRATASAAAAAKQPTPTPSPSPQPADGAAPSQQRSHSGGRRAGSAAQTYRMLERQYKASRPEWKKPSPAFASRIDRLAGAKQPTCRELCYDAGAGTLAAAYGRKEKARATWAKSQSSQREPPPAPASKGCPAYVLPDALLADTPRLAGRRVFVSGTPRLAEPQPLAPGQSSVGLPHGALAAGGVQASPRGASGKPRALPGMASLTPRFPIDKPDARPIGEAVQQTIAGSDAAKPAKAALSWAKSKAPQRPPPKPAHDLAYDVTGSILPPKYHDCAALASATERFESKPEQAPPVGLYTSPFISVGMRADNET